MTLREIIDRVGEQALDRPVVFVNSDDAYRVDEDAIGRPVVFENDDACAHVHVFDAHDDDGELLIVNIRRESHPPCWGVAEQEA